jgi:hypothetical protein
MRFACGDGGETTTTSILLEIGLPSYESLRFDICNFVFSLSSSTFFDQFLFSLGISFSNPSFPHV